MKKQQLISVTVAFVVFILHGCASTSYKQRIMDSKGKASNKLLIRANLSKGDYCTYGDEEGKPDLLFTVTEAHATGYTIEEKVFFAEGVTIVRTVDRNGNVLTAKAVDAQSGVEVPKTILVSGESGYFDEKKLKPLGITKIIKVKGADVKCELHQYHTPKPEGMAALTAVVFYQCLNKDYPILQIESSFQLASESADPEKAKVNSRVLECSVGAVSKMDSVILNDATVIHGKIRQRQLGEYVVIEVSGKQEKITWDRIKEVIQKK